MIYYYLIQVAVEAGVVQKEGVDKSMTIGGRYILNAKITGRTTQKVKNKSGSKILTRPGFP